MIFHLITTLLKYLGYISLTWILLLLSRELYAYFLVRQKAKKEGLPYRYYPALGYLAISQPDQDAMEHYKGFFKDEEIQKTGMFVTNTFPQIGTMVYLITNQVKKDFFAKERDHVKRASLSKNLIPEEGFFFKGGHQGILERSSFADFFYMSNLEHHSVQIIKILEKGVLELKERYTKDGQKNKDGFYAVSLEEFIKDNLVKVVEHSILGEDAPIMDGRKITEHILEGINKVIDLIGHPLSLLTFGLATALKFIQPYKKYFQKQDKLMKIMTDYYLQRRSKFKHSSDVKTTNFIDLNIKNILKQEENGLQAPTPYEVASNWRFFLFGAVDTSLSTLMSFFYLVSIQEGLASELQQDIQEKILDNGKKSLDDMNIEDLNKSDLLEQLIQETLRLKVPTDVNLPREVTKDFKIGNVSFNKGELINTLNVSSPQVYEEEKYSTFDYNNFSQEKVKKRLPIEHSPFSYGVRNCIGKNLAMINMKVFIVLMLKNFDIRHAENFVGQYTYKITYILKESIIGIRSK